MLRIIKIIFMLELAVVMVGIYVITDIYHLNMKDYYKIEEFPYTGIYFSTFHDHINGSFHKIKKEVEENSKFLGWSFTRYDMVGDEDYVVAFDALSSQLFSIDVQKGVWFSGMPEKDGKVPCVIVANGKNDADVGDTLTMGGTDYIVTGIISSEEEFFDLAGSYGNTSTYALSDLKTGLFPEAYRVILCSTENEIEYDDLTSVIAYFDKNLSGKEMEEIREIMEEEGVTESFREMKYATWQECYYKLMEYIPFCVLFLFVSLMGVVTMAVISSKKIIRRYGIFALYGCQWKRIVIGYLEELFLFAAFISVLAAVYAYSAGIYYRGILVVNLLISLAYALLGAAVLHLMKGGRNIMECIRG